ncbi:DUF4023 family protein [Salinibacillus xinjiangensis]|uniref:DUF4023 domain-containing protein n=1 Tax=Salinibacillus xinjiangensis TaxID=1229268 RepID=A0A6G1X8V1_9BACI|nr:DUF4023 family protein [Salinibacillus xinjiangensis]MRG87300.1 DUF4023 domain-containing protein [Salinibacillus xinjiangensis]
MESTSEFVARMHDKQRKDELNRKRGRKRPANRLPSKNKK